MRRTTTIRRLAIGALATLLTTSFLGCGGNSESGDHGESNAPASVDLSWATQNPDAPGPGDQAPVLVIEETLSSPADGDADWADLKGKATVLEFWATWCAPCVQVIPHLNELAEDLSDHDIRFVSITDEEEATVAPFLESIPISGLVALDLDKSAFRDYGVQSIPTTFLVDKEGVVQAVTRAHDVDREDLLDLIAGRRPDVPEIKDFSKLFDLGDEEAEAVFQVLVRPTAKAESGMMRSPHEVRLISFEPDSMLRVAYDVEPGRLVMEAELPDQKFDVVANTGSRQDLLEPVMQQAVSAALGVEASWEERVVEAYVLLNPGEPKLKPLPDDGGHSARVTPRSLAATNLELLAGRVAHLLERPVLDETGLTGRYQIDLKFDIENDPESLSRAIEDTLGLELVLAERPVQMLVVTEHVESDTQ